ncbi:DUF5082 domain-containing protein [Virgibacillus necropolis]|uniref:DUF5082 domain-containing protein n=1 Tax=Virgibacillus necropolis TaxID=163877 RepID=A0A221MIH6_9BACI|nr:DUF5082 domain-containing protein [Virgibacillus necropolis]
MLSDTDFLQSAFAIISSRSSEAEEKLDRLRRAKQNILNEQSSSMSEIRNIHQPTLDALWNGSRANLYDDSRDEAHHTMESIVNDYDHYIQQIEWQITQLNLQKSALGIASSIAHTADELMEQGEEALEELSSTITDLKARLL